MDLCRICLSTSVSKDVGQLETAVFKDEKQREALNSADSGICTEIFSFCLDIQVQEDSKITTKLCSKCFKKTLSFYKFKKLALHNDLYWKSLNLTCSVKMEVHDENGGTDDLSENNNSAIKNEPELRLEDDILEQSDEEFLSVLKSLKSENDIFTDEPKENDTKVINNEPVRKRGRPPVQKNGEKKEKEVCDECGKTVRSLKEHMVKHLPMKERIRVECKVCSKMFSSKAARHRHYKVKHLGIRQHCDICNKDVVDLKSHHLMTHNTAALPYECVICKQRFIRHSALDLHMLKHTKDRPFECEICEKSFKSKTTLQMHKRQVHDKEKTHLCQYCSKTFFKKCHLQTHIRSHTKEKPYKCEECGKSFGTSTILQYHKLTHGEPNYHCDHCSSSFTRRGYLRNHMLSHTKEKRYPCKYCGIRFGRSDHRKRHEFTAHEKNLLATIVSA